MSELERTAPELLALAAWLNLSIEQIPAENRAHVDEYTMKAWRRVSEAIIEYSTICERSRIEALEAENARLLEALNKLDVCDATGGEHVVLSQGRYRFCAECGETLTARKIKDAERAVLARAALKGDT